MKTWNNNSLNQSLSIKEIEKIIKMLKNNKAPVKYEIIAELWKLKKPNLSQKIYKIIKEIWRTEHIPDDWKSALIHHLYKKR